MSVNIKDLRRLCGVWVQIETSLRSEMKGIINSVRDVFSYTLMNY